MRDKVLGPSAKNIKTRIPKLVNHLFRAIFTNLNGCPLAFLVLFYFVASDDLYTKYSSLSRCSTARRLFGSRIEKKGKD